MKTQVFLLVPYDIPTTEINDYQSRQLAKHRFDLEVSDSRGRFDYLVGPMSESIRDPVAEERLPVSVRRSYSGHICECANLPIGAVPGALVTPDGDWHDLTDFGWKMTSEPSKNNDEAFARWERRFRELISLHPYCLVIELWSHS